MLSNGDEGSVQPLAPGATGESTLAGPYGPQPIEISDGTPTPPAHASALPTLGPMEPIDLSGTFGELTDIRPGQTAPIQFADDLEYEDKSTIQRLMEISGDTTSDEDGEEKGTDAVPFRTGYVYSPLMMLHAHPATDLDDEDGGTSPHPECPERISGVYAILKRNGCVEKMKAIRIRPVKMSEVMLVHDQGMWTGVERTAFFHPATLASQTTLLESMYSLYVNKGSAFCARLSCGGVIEMCDAVASGKVRNGFAIVRPPGHHAEPDKSMGFCFYNNVAVAARYLQEKYGQVEGPSRCKRILILDWDVHHGNGTQSAFWEDADVLYVSIHRYENGTFYPGGRAGDYSQVGAGAGRGRNVNIPWPDAGMGDGEYIAAFQRIVMPIAIEFAPDLVIISAGFDAAKGDQLGECFVSPAGYAHMTYDLASLANGRLVVALEGGYNIDAIAASALDVTEVLLGDAPKPLEPNISRSFRADEALRLVEREQSRFWHCMRKPDHQAEPGEDEGLSILQLSHLLAVHRAVEVSKRFDLQVWPFHSLVGDSEVPEGQCLCSPDLFSTEKKTLIFFVHDMGNMRIHMRNSIEIEPQKELLAFVDGSSLVMQWAKDSNLALIDLNLNVELPSRPRPPMPGRPLGRAKQLAASEALQRDRARMLTTFVWDNCITMRLGLDTDVNVVLIGLGTACEAIMHVIEQRKVMDCVRAVVQIPSHGVLPATSKGSDSRRKWYFQHSRVYLPYDHAHFKDEEAALTAKRFGKIVRSNEQQAIQVLRKEFDNIRTFIESSLPSPASQAQHQAPPMPADTVMVE